MPAGKGLVLVIIGPTGATTMVKLKGWAPLLPVALVAVTVKEFNAETLGVPVSKPLEESEAQEGNPLAVQVMVGVPDAANW